jgi:hypothetical protein
VNGPRNLILAVMFVILAAGFSNASDIYFAQNAAGSNNGTSCANAYAYNDGTHGINAAGNWAAGNTLHLCGTITAPAGANNFITAQASGSSGSVIMLKFETGAALTATYWGGPAINLNNKSYITIDGGTNGSIQATANGSALANQQDNGVCVRNANSASLNSTNLTVQNLTCANLYVDSSPADNGGQDTFGIDIFNGYNLVIKNNTIHDVKWAIRNGWYNNGFAYSNIVVTGNNIYNMDHGWFGSDAEPTGTANVSGIYVYGNMVGSMANWDNTLDLNHHDWFHLNATSATSNLTNFYLYNNYGSGDPGAYGGGGFFSYPNYTGTESGLYIFNNVFVNTSTNHSWAVGFVAEYSVGTTLLVNNTFVSNAVSPAKDNGIHTGISGTGLTSKNNILQGIANAAVYVDSTSSATTLDSNDYYASPSWFKTNWYAALPSWQSGTGYDSHATAGNAKLTNTYHLTGNTSAAWQTAESLYSICNNQPNPGLGALCLDNAGVQRQSAGNWDIGAYEDSASGDAPAPPTGLAAVVQ